MRFEATTYRRTRLEGRRWFTTSLSSLSERLVVRRAAAS